MKKKKKKEITNMSSGPSLFLFFAFLVYSTNGKVTKMIAVQMTM